MVGTHANVVNAQTDARSAGLLAKGINQADTDANAGEQTRPPQNNFQATYQVAFLFGSP
ncbi:TPA: hypothetical protein RJ115_004404 [Yersinia enterocolitica]|nr:hypothetical protein [Yersinia enterocolitica]